MSTAARWGVREAVVGFVVGVFASALAVSAVLSAKGLDDVDQLSLTLFALLQIPLWLGLLGVPLVAARVMGNGPVADFGLRTTWRDAPIGLALGVVCQVVLVPVVLFPFLELTSYDADDVEAAARELTDKATEPLGVILLVLVVGVGAPLAEEVFYRGLLLRSLSRTWPAVASVGLSSVLFAASHFQLIQFPALLAFGLVLGVLAHHSGRLGPAIWAHVGFNLTTVVNLVWLS